MRKGKQMKQTHKPPFTVRTLLAAVLALGFSGAGCTARAPGPQDPERALSDYISLSFASKSPEDRPRLAALLTGEARERLLTWSDDQFREAFVDSKRKFVKLGITQRKPVNENEVSLTYELIYLDEGRGHEAKITNRKLARIVREEGRWKISEVRNVKELIEYKNEMSLP